MEMGELIKYTVKCTVMERNSASIVDQIELRSKISEEMQSE